jgi:hypothetical protein
MKVIVPNPAYIPAAYEQLVLDTTPAIDPDLDAAPPIPHVREAPPPAAVPSAETAPKKANWTDEDEKKLVDFLTANSNEFQAESGWKTTTWTAAAAQINTATRKKAAPQYKNKWTNVSTFLNLSVTLGV